MSASPDSPRDTVPAEAFRQLSIIHQLTLETSLCATGRELIFRMLNRTVALAPYGRAWLWRFGERGAKPLGCSGQTELDPHLPATEARLRLVETLRERRESGVLGEPDFPGREAEFAALNEGSTRGLSVLWLPLVVEERVVGGLWLERWAEHGEWTTKEMGLLNSLLLAYGAGWRRLLGEPTWRERLSRRRTKPWLLVGGLLLVYLLFIHRAPLRIVAHCEVIPADPLVVAAPLDGVIARVLVAPGQEVAKDAPLFRYDDQAIQSDLNVARQQVKIIESDLQRSTVQAFQDEKARARILTLENKLQQERIKLQLAQDRGAKVEVRAPAAGVVVMTDRPQDWAGRPVAVGERVLSLIDPARTKLNLWLPEKDNINFERKTPLRIFLSVAPQRTLEAKLTYVAKDITVSAEGVASFRAEAEWAGPHGYMPVGLTGTAMLYGEPVSTVYWLLRKPLAAVRYQLGI